MQIPSENSVLPEFKYILCIHTRLYFAVCVCVCVCLFVCMYVSYANTSWFHKAERSFSLYVPRCRMTPYTDR